VSKLLDQALEVEMRPERLAGQLVRLGQHADLARTVSGGAVVELEGGVRVAAQTNGLRQDLAACELDVVALRGTSFVRLRNLRHSLRRPFHID
jgi:hypothetical protein